MPKTKIKALSKPTTPSSVDEDCNPKDYLQDPELWRDELPQPFRMINDVLQELLSIAWSSILAVEQQRREEAARPRTSRLVPSCSLEVPGMRCHVTAGSALLMGVSEGLATVDLSETSPQQKLLQTADSTPVLSLASQPVCLPASSTQCWLVAAVSETGVSHFLLHTLGTIRMKDIEFTGERQPTACSLSLGASHLAMAFQEDGGPSLEVHQLPVSQWLADVHSSLTKHRDSIAAEQEGSPEGGDEPPGGNTASSPPPFQPPEPSSLAKPTFLRKMSPPLSLQPCSDCDPAFALAGLRSTTKQCLPTGEKHILTDNFFNNRLKVFTSLRSDFLLEPVSLTGHSAAGPPHCHFLHYKNGSHSTEPLSLLLWWEGGTQLHQHSLAVNPKAKDPAPPLERVWPQLSAITCSSISEDGTMLALGLKEGAVVVSDLKQSLFHHVFHHPSGSPVCCVSFHPSSSHTAPLLLVGDAAGEVYKMDAGKSLGDPNRISNYSEEVLKSAPSEKWSPVTDLVIAENANTVLTLHKDGCLRRLSPTVSHFKPSGVVRRTELASVSRGSHVVVICSHGNLHDDGSKETAHASSKVYLFDMNHH